MTAQSTAVSSLDDYYSRHEAEILEHFFTFLRFKSVSSEPEYKKECAACLSWLQGYLADMGFEAERWETTGHPTLFASWMGAGANKPTLLLYGHYDVQPVDPIELWDSDPFEPEIRDGQVYARGACDNKGQIFYAIQALRALLERDGQLPINVKLVIEGEEEMGSAGLQGILEARREDLRADYLAIVDVGLTAADQPAVTLGFRGIVTMDVVVKGTLGDLHSGSHGGMAYNPLHGLSELIAGLRDESGRVTVPGFYDDVDELSADERARYAFDFEDANYERDFGAKPTGGERAYTAIERQWIRPTVECNGIIGGYTGDGFKTVIPAEARAKLSCRTVPSQDPAKVGQLVAKALEERCPAGLRCSVTVHPGSGAAMRSGPDSRVVQAFAEAYSEVLHKPCQYILCGGSIPITADLAQASGSEIVLVGYHLDSDNIHAPNEHFGVQRMRHGFLTIARTIEILGKPTGT